MRLPVRKKFINLHAAAAARWYLDQKEESARQAFVRSFESPYLFFPLFACACSEHMGSARVRAACLAIGWAVGERSFKVTELGEKTYRRFIADAKENKTSTEELDETVSPMQILLIAIECYDNQPVCRLKILDCMEAVIKGLVSKRSLLHAERLRAQIPLLDENIGFLKACRFIEFAASF